MTDREVLQALLDGKKVREMNWGKDEYIHLVDNTLVGEDGLTYGFLVDPEEFVECKKYAVLYTDGNLVIETCVELDLQHDHVVKYTEIK